MDAEPVTQVAAETQNPAEPTPKTGVVDQEVGQQAAEGEQKPSEGKKPEDKAISGLKRSLGRQTAARYEAQARAETLERDVGELRQRLAALQGGQEQDDGSKRPKTLTDSDIDKLARARAQEMRAEESLADRAKTVMKEAKAIDGFEEAREALWAELAPVKAGKPTPFFEAIMDSDHPAKLIHYLGSNLDEAAEFENLTPAQIGRRIAKLESKLATPQKAVSNAPKPLEPVKAGAPSGKSLMDMSPAEYAAFRRKQISGQTV